MHNLAQGMRGRFFAEGSGFGPEIDAVDQAMGEPEGAMMGMIVFFVGGLFHGPGAGHFRATRADERVEVHLGRPAESVFGKEFAVDFHPDPVVFFSHGDVGVNQCGWEKKETQGEKCAWGRHRRRKLRVGMVVYNGTSARGCLF